MNNAVVIIVLLLFIPDIKSQDKIYPGFDSTNYSIENCVNEFSLDNIEETKVGYQYWFADRDFLDGRTIKLSMVGPHSSTHAPHKHSGDEFFFVLEGTAYIALHFRNMVLRMLVILN
jgi:hypothetical protein